MWLGLTEVLKYIYIYIWLFDIYNEDIISVPMSIPEPAAVQKFMFSTSPRVISDHFKPFVTHITFWWTINLNTVPLLMGKKGNLKDGQLNIAGLTVYSPGKECSCLQVEETSLDRWSLWVHVWIVHLVDACSLLDTPYISMFSCKSDWNPPSPPLKLLNTKNKNCMKNT